MEKKLKRWTFITKHCRIRKKKYHENLNHPRNTPGNNKNVPGYKRM